MKEQSGINWNVVWFYNEFFYSNYDLKYFESTPMKEVYSELGLNPEITLREHKQIMQALPKPKLFNDKLLLTEKTKLEQFRNNCRQNTKNVNLYQRSCPKTTKREPNFQCTALCLLFIQCADTCILAPSWPITNKICTW